MKIDSTVGDILCSYCFSKLELIIETKEKLQATITNQATNPEEPSPAFDIEFEEISEIEYTPYFNCPKCKMRAYDANTDLVYDELILQIIFPKYDPKEKLGYKKTSFQYPFSPDITEEEEKLPTIVKASSRKETEKPPEKPVPEISSLMDGLGWE